MKKLTEGLIIAVSVLGMLGCSSNGSSSSSNDSGGGFTGITKALLLNQDGGNGLGLWSVLDSNLSSLDANYTTSGVPVSDPNDIFNAGGRVGVGGDKTGFSLNPADGNFYAVMTGSLEDSNEPLGAQSYNDSLVVKFDPRTDALEVVTKIPEFNKDTYEKPMSRYTLKPVISPDGKSLLAFATVGGKVLPTTPANPNDKLTSGGVVHIDIDPTSPTYGSAHLVFEFADYSINSLNWEDNIHTVRTEPLFFDDGNASVFLGSEYLEIYDPGDACGQSATNKNCIVSGKLFCITPTDDSNWSQPWVMRSGMYRHSSILGRTAHYETSDKSIWIVEERNGFDVVAVKLDTDGNEDPSWNQGRIINNVVNGTLYPQAVIGIDIQSPLVWTQGSQAVAPTLLTIRENSDPVIDSVAGYTGSNTLPVHLAKTKWSQKIWVNAASMTDPSSFDSSIQFLKETHPYGSADYSKSLQQLWDEHYVAESTLKKIDRTSGASIKIFSGSAANGNFLAGAPALSDDFSYSNVDYYDRYVVSLTLRGGEAGMGTVVKDDRFTGAITYTPLGNTGTGYPVGKVYQLSNTKVLGGTSLVGKALTEPMESKVGVWVYDVASATVTDERLPSTNVRNYNNTQDVLFEANKAPVSFVKAKDGRIWANAQYLAWDITLLFAQPTYTGLRSGLVRFDGNTGKIVDGPFITSADPKHINGETTAISGNGDYAMFFEGAGLNDTFNTGQNLIVYDLSSSDMTQFNKLSFSDQSAGASGGLWDAQFSPVYDENTSSWYALTRKNAASDELNIVKISPSSVNDTVMTNVTVTNMSVTWPSDVNSSDRNTLRTAPFRASNAKIYFGTSDAKLISYNPDDNSVAVVADFALSSPDSSELRGFLNEEDGVLVGLIVDSTDSVSESATRVFRYDLTSETVIGTVDVTGKISTSEEFPGVNFISN